MTLQAGASAFNEGRSEQSKGENELVETKMDVGNSLVKSVVYSSKTYSKRISVGHFITTCLVIFSDQKDVNRRN